VLTRSFPIFCVIAVGYPGITELRQRAYDSHQAVSSDGFRHDGVERQTDPGAAQALVDAFHCTNPSKHREYERLPRRRMT